MKPSTLFNFTADPACPSALAGAGESQPFLTSLRDELRRRNFSRKTIKSYLYYNHKFLLFARKSPRAVTGQDIKNYLNYLANKEHSSSSLNLALNALKFYYRNILKRRFFVEIKIWLLGLGLEVGFNL